MLFLKNISNGYHAKIWIAKKGLGCIIGSQVMEKYDKGLTVAFVLRGENFRCGQFGHKGLNCNTSCVPTPLQIQENNSTFQLDLHCLHSFRKRKK